MYTRVYTRVYSRYVLELSNTLLTDALVLGNTFS